MQANWFSIRNVIAKMFPGVPRITTQELADWLDDPGRDNPLLFDVREKAEFEVSHLKDARWSPHADEILAIANGLPALDKSKPIVVYCSVGYRSAKVAKALIGKHNRQVFNLEGSIFQWFNDGRAVWRDSDADSGSSEIQVREVHPYNAMWGKLLRKT